MKRGLMLCGVLLMLITHLVVAQDAQPSARVVEDTFAFGKVIQGTKLNHRFIIENRGSAPLKIASAKAECGCTVVDHPDVVAPGQSGEITVNVDTTELAGIIRKKVLIKTDDPENPDIILTVTGTVQELIRILPKNYLVFNNLASEDVEKNIFVMTEREGNDFKILGIESDLPYLKITKAILPDDQRLGEYPNRQYILAVKPGKDAPIGYHKGTITVRTNLKEQPQKKIKVTTFIRPDVMAMPVKMDLGRFQRSNPPKRIVWVSDNTKKIEGFDVRDVKADNDFVLLDMERLPNDTKIAVHVTIAADAPIGPFEGTITIKTTAEKPFDSLTVSYRGEVEMEEGMR